MPLFLASASPRRRELLKQAGLKFKVIVPHVSEVRLSRETPHSFVLRISKEKAHTVWSKYLKKASGIVLAADTIVVFHKPNRVLGKPKNKNDALKMIRLIQGKSHTVFTGYTLLKLDCGNLKKEVSRVVRSQVKICSLNSIQQIQYFNCGESMDKAGAYAAQGAGAGIIEKINGSYTNVVGLPLCHVLRDLENL